MKKPAAFLILLLGVSRFLGAEHPAQDAATANDHPGAWHLKHRCAQREKILWDVEFSPDGKRLVTACYDGTALVREAETGKRLVALRLPPLEGRPGRGGIASYVDWSPDGTKILVGGPPVVIFDATTYKPLQTFPAVEGVFFANSKMVECGGDLSSGGSGPYPVSLWHVESGRQIDWPETGINPELHRKLCEKEHWINWDWPDYPGGQRHVVTVNLSKTVRFWDQVEGVLIQSLGKATGPMEALEASVARDGRTIVVQDWDRTKVWRRGRNKPIAEFKVWEDRMKLSHDGNTLAAWTAPPHLISIYDTGTGALTGRVLHSAGALRAVALSPDGSMMASVGMGKQLLIWTRRTENEDDPDHESENGRR